jgi:prolyl oligopeptidase
MRSAIHPGLALITLLIAAPLSAQEKPDPFLWLEEVEGRRAMDWVEAKNAATIAELSRSPVYQPMLERTKQILDARERIAYPSIIGDRLYNFWQDAANPRGLWRRTSWESYLGGSPQWETVLDIDALAKGEGLQWSFAGAECLPPAYTRCLMYLSRGGADATQVREFDVNTKVFIPGGFMLAEAKQSLAWVDENTVLIATNFGAGSMTTSGYARIAKLWRRGTPLSAATTLLEAPATDMGVWAGGSETVDGTINVVSHRRNFYEGHLYVLQNGKLVQLDLPLDSEQYLLGKQLIVYIRSPWEVGGKSYSPASLLAIPLADFIAGGRAFTTVLVPGEKETIQGVSTTAHHLLVGMLDNVRGELRRYSFSNGNWSHETVPAPPMGSVGVVATSPRHDRYFFTYSGFTQPNTLYLADEAGKVTEVKRLPEQFDAKGLEVEQHEAVSKDGTRIPFFIIHREGITHDGTNPTLLYAYGGFEVSQTPSYNAINGAAWLERGGVYVVANIRGGGEFGPAWHRAGLKENRQRIYDDFFAVAQFLIGHGVTNAGRLGIMGGSNGGLLMGVAMTQHPELFGAIVVQVPLLDMRRYNKLLAGASWMAEYGNPDIPEEWAYISRYSPYQNLAENVKYPKVFFTTTTRDDRVHPGHARKMAAKMESMGYPFYYFENTEGGHGAGVTSEQRAKAYALTYAYLWQQLGGT